jgi:hypothetical protein
VGRTLLSAALEVVCEAALEGPWSFAIAVDGEQAGNLRPVSVPGVR